MKNGNNGHPSNQFNACLSYLNDVFSTEFFRIPTFHERARLHNGLLIGAASLFVRNDTGLKVELTTAAEMTHLERFRVLAKSTCRARSALVVAIDCAVGVSTNLQFPFL